MTIHPYITLAELIEYCQMCHEHGGKCKQVRLNAPCFQRVRQVARITGDRTEFLGIKFVQR